MVEVDDNAVVEPKRQQSAASSGRHEQSSGDTFQSDEPLNLNQMMEERRKSRTSRPRNAFTALRTSLSRSGGNNSQLSHDDDAVAYSQRKTSSNSLFRRDSRGSLGSERSGGGGSDHGFGSESSQLNRRKDRKTSFALPHFLSQTLTTSVASPIENDLDDERQFSVDNDGEQKPGRSIARTIRRYGAGQYVLISNHGLAEGTPFLVNIYGFPEGGGGALTPEQRRGPYNYLLAQVKRVHFEENAQYYTITRCDNDEDQRADAAWMEPITDPMGIEAAKTAAKKKNSGHYLSEEDRILFLSSVTKGTANIARRILIGASLFHRKLKEQASKCLSGRRPYKISFKFTGVNFLVLCSLWYLYIDQFRLAFLPHAADFSCAIVSW